MARPGLRNHPKFKRLCRILQAPSPHVLGYLECMWETAYENGEDLIGDASCVEAVCEWPGDDGILCDALLNCGGSGREGFIEQIPGREGVFFIHDLYDHAPDYVQKRMEREAGRIKKGKTISDIRREAGRAGGLKSGETRKISNQAEASDCHLLHGSKQNEANGATPAPAPAPAPAPIIPPIVPQGTLSQEAKPRKKTKGQPIAYSEAFQKFWELYPAQRREEKAKAFEAWKLACSRTADRGGKSYLLDRIAAYAPYGESKGTYCPQPATWLNQERYDDSPESYKRNDNAAPQGEQFDLVAEARKAREARKAKEASNQ